MTSPTQRDPYAIILAGGDGVRLQQLTKLICGDHRPKQFCPIFGRQTLLGRTRERLRRVIPPEQTLYSVTRAHKRFYVRALADVERWRVLVQPFNRGTAPAIAFATLTVLNRDPDAVIAFLPADHFYQDDNPFVEALQHSAEAARRNPKMVVLLGAEPDRPETEYGWIEPKQATEFSRGFGNSGVRSVVRFWEKPTPAHAQDLFRRGCLWNTFVMVGRAEAFRDLLYATLPGMMIAFEDALNGALGFDSESLEDLYRKIPSSDFSHQVLSSSTERLLVRKLARCGWSDLGKPERVFESLARVGIQPEWQMHATSKAAV